MEPHNHNPDSERLRSGSPLEALEGQATALDLKAVDYLIGQVLESRYRIDEEVGRGGMGVVYRGTDLTLSRPVAIKTILHRQSDTETLTRFIHEAKTLAQIEHRRLVPVYAVGQDEGYHYLVMKFLEGETLAQRLRREGRQSSHFTRQIVSQVCEALGAIHDVKLIHRDIKPANIMISPQGEVTVMDLGIAKRIGEDNNTSASIAIGTPRYMPPEAVDNRPLDPRADLYSLGIIAFQMLVGKTPFDGPTPMSILYQQAHQRPPLAREIVSDIPKNLETAIEISLQKSPEDRFQDSYEMMQAFDESASFVDASSKRKRALQIAFITGILGTTLVFSDLFSWREKVEPPVAPPQPVAVSESRDAQTEPTSAPPKAKTQKRAVRATSTSRASKNALRPKSRTPSNSRPLTPQPPSKSESTQQVLLRVVIRSQPSNALVYLQGKRVGKTPYKITKPKGEAQSYVLKLKGFKQRKVTLRDQDVRVQLTSVFEF